MRQKVKKSIGLIKEVAVVSPNTQNNTVLSLEPWLPATRKARRPGPLRLVELFAVTMAISAVAFERGWEIGEPVALPNYDLYDQGHQRQAAKYLRDFDPDVMVVLLPTTPWSTAQSFGEKLGPYWERLAEHRGKTRALLSWMQEMVLEHRARDCALVAAAPSNATVWQEPLVIDAWAGMPTGCVDVCAYGMQRPAGEWDLDADGARPLYLKCSTRIVGTGKIVQAVQRTCPGNHRHAPGLGGVQVKGRWCSLSEFAGGFPSQFCLTMVRAAEEYLKSGAGLKRRRGESFHVVPRLPEETFMEEEADFYDSFVFEVQESGAGAEDQEDLRHNEHDPNDHRDSPGGPELVDIDVDEDEEDQRHNKHDPNDHRDSPRGASSKQRLSDKSKLERLHILHRRLGHPSNETLVRMLQHGGASDDMVRLASTLACPSCQLSRAPKKPFPSRPALRAVVFNTTVHADLKYLHDFRGGVYVALSVVDEATNFHQARLLRTREPAHVAAKFLSMWIGVFGTPQTIRLDQGGEWESDFIQMLEGHSIHSEFVGSHSPWSNGYAERHGALLGVAVQATVEEKQLVGRAQMKIGLACACQAKNSIVSRSGHSAHYLVFGRQACYPELLEDEIWSKKSMGFALSIEGEVARMAELRSAARVGLLKGDVVDKIKRALKRAPAGDRREYSPGELVYFWSPAKPTDRRYRRDLGAWRGPAVVLMPDGSERYFISWRARCLLVSGANLKGATVEEASRQDLRLGIDDMDLAKGFEDLTDQPPPPEEPEAPFSVQGPRLALRRRADGTGRRLTEARRMMAGLKAVRKTLKMPGIHRRRRPVSREPRAEMDLEVPVPPPEVPQAPDLPAPSSAVPEPPNSPAPSSPLLWGLASPVSLPPEDPNYNPLDDVPRQLKRRRSEDTAPEDVVPNLKRLRTEDFANFVLTAVSEGEIKNKGVRANEWLPRAEVDQLSELLDLPLSSVRLHRTARKRLQNPGPRHRKARVTVMFGQDPGQALVVQETAKEVDQRPRRRCPHLWRGITMFLRRDTSHLKKGELRASRKLWKQKKEHSSKVYVAKGEEIFCVNVSDEQVFQAAAEDLRDYVMVMEAFFLKLKANGKELDPRLFNEEERKAFEKSDEKEWKAWLDNKVVEQLDQSEAKTVSPRRIFRVPARVVRVNKAPAGTKDLLAKSRIVLPGHLDPDVGSLRTDAPTTQMAAVRMATSIGLSRGWKFLLFDVSTAFLSGKEVNRDLFVRPPNDLKCAGAGVLWRILKSAYGLSEAPRLWYIQAKELLSKCGFEEVPFCPATFVKRVRRAAKLSVVAILCLHVDDGFLAVENGRTMNETRNSINNLFTIKEWITVEDKPTPFLGMRVYVKNGIFYNDMNDYILELKEGNYHKLADDEALDANGLKEFRRVIAQLRWPIHLVLPEKLFLVSSLAQRVGAAKTKDLKAANHLMKEIKMIAARRGAVLRFRALQGEPLLVSYFDVSLGKAAETAAQRGEIHFLTDRHVLQGSGSGNVIEFHSNKIARVVRSSMAAECSSMSGASDRLIFNQKLYDSLAYGLLEVPNSWREELRCEGHLVTDAKSLFDHVKGSGLLTTERQVSLDILGVRQMIQDGCQGLHWVPTWRQHADILTKDMIDELFGKFRLDGKLNVVQTPSDEKEEERRASLRRAQRVRRKLRMQNS
eukprot:s391_g12.t1